jgi:hypothetical protein
MTSSQTTDHILFVLSSRRAQFLKNIADKIEALDPLHPNYAMRLAHLQGIEADLLKGAVPSPALSRRTIRGRGASRF